MLKVDAIVNPAHPSLRAGEGLCEIIHNRAGKNLETYCRMLGEHEYDDAVITPAFNLPHCKNVIHACAPYWVNYNCLCSKEPRAPMKVGPRLFCRQQTHHITFMYLQYNDMK